jgi:hypothetical protein
MEQYQLVSAFDVQLGILRWYPGTCPYDARQFVQFPVQLVGLSSGKDPLLLTAHGDLQRRTGGRRG